MYSYQFNSMSTLVRISMNVELFANDMMPVYKLFESIEDTCSRFRKDSELSYLNQQVGKETKVSNNMFHILKEALRFYHETDGIFNPAVLDAIKNNGYEKSIEYIREKQVEAAVSKSVAISGKPFVLNEESQSVILTSKIDLGGIAKGWVIDRAAELLSKIGFGFVNVGGDIRIFGTLPRPLNVGIESPVDQSNMISSIQATTGGIATSTSMKRRWLVNGEWKHHLIDPRTGSPSESSIISATVTAPTALEADIWAKTVLLLGQEKGQQWIEQRGISAALIDKSGQIWRKGE